MCLDLPITLHGASSIHFKEKGYLRSYILASCVFVDVNAPEDVFFLSHGVRRQAINTNLLRTLCELAVNTGKAGCGYPGVITDFLWSVHMLSTPGCLVRQIESFNR